MFFMEITYTINHDMRKTPIKSKTIVIPGYKLGLIGLTYRFICSSELTLLKQILFKLKSNRFSFKILPFCVS